MPRLLVNPDSPEAWPIELGLGTLTLGSGPENDVALEHSSVSSAHCRITCTEHGVWVKDLGSTSGTFINGELIEEARLAPGQSLRLGEILLRLECEAPAEAARPGMPPRAPRIGPATARPAPLAAGARRPAAPRNFFAAIPRAFVYPFQGNGFILLAAGTVFFYLIRYIPFVGLLLTGYMFAYAKSIITTTAAGREEPPDWPDLGDLMEDIVIPYLQLAALVILSFGPAIIIGFWRPGTPADTRTAQFVALGFGTLFAPMGMLALAMFDSVAVLNPIALSWCILRAPLHYLVAAASFVAVLLLDGFAAGALRELLPVPFLPEVMTCSLNLYFVCVGMRILGLLYTSKADQFGWFDRTGR
jgi:hypothetical protein